jgi:hypothetical protein
VKAYVNGLPFTDLGKGYIGSVYGDILNLMATISLFAITLGTASGAARIMFAQARDATGKKTGLAGLSKHGAPALALVVAGEPKEPRWQVVIPVLGCALVLYTIYRNVLIGQEGTYAHLPWIELVYLIVGLGVVVVAPGLAGRVRVGLAASEAA